MQVFTEGVSSARQYFAENRIDTLPVLPGSKICPVTNWQFVSPDEAWLHAPSDANIAIRCGGILNLAVIDIDEEKKSGTKDVVFAYLNGLGLNILAFPQVKTVSQVGRHIYIRLDSCPGDNRRLFKKEVGEGDIRLGSGSYVVAPPSIVSNQEYELINGDFKLIPVISLKDLFPLISDFEQITQHKPAILPMSRLARTLLRGNYERG